MHSIKDTVKQLIGKSLDAYNKKYTSPINNRIDNIVAQAGTDNTEIVDARIDSAGVSHTTLNNRILAETKMTDEKLIEYTGSSLSVDDTMPGYLQNIEIKGNTIQNEDNLEDIRSVGNKIEGQDLYEIPVLSRGKNLFDEMNLKRLSWGGTNWNLETLPLTSDGNYQNYSAFQTNLRLKPNTTYTLKFKWRSVTGVTGQAHRYIRFQFKDVTNKRYSASINGMGGFDPNTDSHYNLFAFNGESSSFVEKSISFTTPNEVLILDKLSNQVCEIKANYIQLEEGTQATPYEPYQEDKLTILSPVQLEKVGDVADRIIEKDGVWGVEKNIKTVRLGNESVWSMRTNKSGIKLFATRDYLSNGISDRVILCDALTVNNGVNQDTIDGYNQILAHKNSSYSEYIYISKDFESITLFTAWLDENPINIKYVTETEPVFMPLPHDQQVKLRTFANKTNISFLTKIEGTIKAQVPKSLGATVNTHTEQINNLNKELDRVKKLEESIVSTVTTESDFTTVEATSNGYFEDVKLEGKTLVNYISNFNNWSNMGSTTVSEDGASMTINATSWNRGRQISKSLPSGEYIFSINNPDRATVFVQNKTIDKTLFNGNDININIKFSLLEVSEILIICKNTSETGTYVVSKPILTTDKNINGYFEGLKSVGQSDTTSEDGADEIVVESVNKNLININSKDIHIPSSNGVNKIVYTIEDNSLVIKSNGAYNWGFVSFNNVKVKPNTTYTLTPNADIVKGNASVWVHDNFDNKLFEINNVSKTFTTNNSTTSVSIRFYCQTTTTYTDACIKYRPQLEEGTQATLYTPHQSDKKRLLYYNNETQTWEKPILREWDSIEKHTDGKYYYHQRSGEVVLNGSEDWVVRNDLPTDNPQGTHLVFYVQDESFPIKVRPNDLTSIVWISDIVQPISHTYGWNTSVEGLHFGTFNKPQGVNNCRYFMNIAKSRLTTQDVQGFKQWLQANNVTVVYQLAEEKVYECTNIDLITYANETNYIVESGAIAPKSILKVHNNISNVVSLLQKKVSLLESNMTKYMITQNRMQLASTYSADSVTFKVDYALCSEEVEYNEDLYNLILNNILVGKDNYDYNKMFNIILDYASWNQISWEQFDILVGVMVIQHNPPVEDEVIEEIPNEIM